MEVCEPIPRLAQQWTRDRRMISRAVERVNSSGGTAMYDAIADAIPFASAGEKPQECNPGDFPTATTATATRASANCGN
jgi:hypothetical protein